MITVTGRTFEHRNLLKQMRGQWKPSAQAWEFYSLSPSEIQQLRNTVGLVVTEQQPPAQPEPEDDNDGDDDVLPEPLNDLDALLAKLMGGSVDEETKPIHGRDGVTRIFGDDLTYFNYFKDCNPRAFFGFSSLGAMVDYVEPLKPNGPGYRPGKWHGSEDMAEAIQLARYGWQEGVDNAQEVIDAISVQHATGRRRSFNVSGGAVSVGRMLSGDPMHMVRRPHLPSRRIVSLFVECIASAGINVKTLIARAAVIAALTDIMERDGYSCEIVALCTVTDDRQPGAQTAVKVKNAGEKLNLFDMSFALGHPSFLRRLSFACICSSIECRSFHFDQGLPTFAFNKHHPTKRNEFYIRPITIPQQRTLNTSSIRSRAISMLPFVKPHNLPISIVDTIVD